MDVLAPYLLPLYSLPAPSMSKQKVINSWKLTPTDSEPKPQKVKTPNKLDMSCQEEFSAKEKRLGNLLGERFILRITIPLLHPDTKEYTSLLP